MFFVDYTLTNIQNIRLTKIVSYVPEEYLPDSQILLCVSSPNQERRIPGQDAGFIFHAEKVIYIIK